MTKITITPAIRTRRARNSGELVTAENLPQAGDLIDVDGDSEALVVYSGALIRIQPDANCGATNTYTRDDLLASHARFSHVEG